MRILIDFDDVLNNLAECWVADLNRCYHLNARMEDIKDYDISKVFPKLRKDQVLETYLDGNPYLDIVPVQGAKAFLKLLEPEDEVYVVTSNIMGIDNELLSEYVFNGGNPRATEFMLQFLWQYYPEIPQDHIVITRKKELVKGDVLIDDNPDNLLKWGGPGVLIDKPWNRDFDCEVFGISRAKTWGDVYTYIDLLRRSLP